MCRADSVQGEQAGGAGGHQGNDQLVQALQLAVGELRAPPQFPQRDPGRVADDVAGPGPQRRQRGGQGRGGVPGEPCPQVIGAGQDQGPGLVDRLGALADGAAPGGHQRPDRLDLPVPAPGNAAGPARAARPGRR